ncbi:MAG: lipid-A-disaccharide synthase [Chlamydiales bacterium]|nr:lipid-A-disaccharide synthase [Chlamydiales bacterium]
MVNRTATLDLLILAAEPSGDLHGESLIQQLLEQKPDLQIGALAGPRMRKLSIQTIGTMESLQVMGFIDVLLALPRIFRQFFSLRDTILRLNPSAVVCIDYPGFHLRLQKALRKKGYKGKLIHYICPSVWAWGKKRIGVMEKNLDLLLCLFPFEKNCFINSKLPVVYVGHPLTQAITNYSGETAFREIYRLPGSIIALFPGSRKEEIEKNLPLQLETARKLCEVDPTLQIAISIASKDLEAQIWSLAGLKAISIPSEHTYDLMRHCHLAIATSGTITLELALHRVPTIVMYSIKPIDFFLIRKIFRINLPFYCIVNIITSSRVYPEFFGSRLVAQHLYDASFSLLQDPAARAECQKGCDQLKKLLDNLPASTMAAEQILRNLDF